MPKVFKDLIVGLDEVLEEKLKLLSPGFSSYQLHRKSVDARGKVPHWVLTLTTYGAGEKPPQEEFLVAKKKVSSASLPVLVVGAGPAGLFAALRLSERGIPCQLFEQGSIAPVRMRAIADYWRYNRLHPFNNVCFGEGGAGLYSDGKLITRIRSPYIPYVLNRLVKFGAPAEIEYLGNPHVGSDRIRRVIPPLREHLKALGCTVRFDSRVIQLLYEGNKVVGLELADGSKVKGRAVLLATGHSATNLIMHLHQNGVAMEGKSFAVGFRIEHPQAEIDQIQYGAYAGHPQLGAANYRLADHDKKSGVGVYSFCMCPGGYVIASSTEPDGLVSNGMSNFMRNSPYANSAIVISIDHQKYFGSDLLGGMAFRREIEIRAKSWVLAQKGNKQFPAQKLSDFLEGKLTSVLPTSSPSGVVPARLDTFFDQAIYQRISKSLIEFQRKMPGFVSQKAQLFAVESRTSCPLRILRDENTFESISHSGLFPVGEGAGYAGGITSAAVDGVRSAEAISESCFPE